MKLYTRLCGAIERLARQKRTLINEWSVMLMRTTEHGTTNTHKQPIRENAVKNFIP